MLTRTASPRIARGAAAAAAAALKNKGAAATPPPRVFLLLPRAPTAAMMPSMMPQHHHHHLRPPPAASLPRALPVSCAYLGRDFVPWPSARRQRAAASVVSSPALGKDRLVLVTLGSEDDDEELENASSSSSDSSSGGLSATSPLVRGSSDSSGGKRRRKKKRPLVILFGWLGARAKDLDKYAEAWQALGFDTLTARPPLAAVLLPPLGTRAADAVLSLARKALEEEEGEGNGDRKVIAHVFSNAGFLFSGTCLAREAELQQQPLLLRSRLRGVIFDSCPARVDEDMALRGISAAARGVPAARAAAAKEAEEEEENPSTSSSSLPHSILSPPLPLPPSSSSSLRDSALRVALRAFLRSGPIERAMEAAWRAWEGAPPSPTKPTPTPTPTPTKVGSGVEEGNGFPPPPSCPRVYAYSLSDALIPPESVEAVAAAAAARAQEKKKKEKGGGETHSSSSSPSLPLPLPPVSLRVFDSPHCEHLRWHPREYLELMEGFSTAIVEEEEEEEEEEDAILQL